MSLILSMAIFSLLLRIGLIDWEKRKILNQDIFILLTFTLCHFLSSQPDWTLLLTNLVVALALTLPGFLLGLSSGGDIKLMIALSPLWQPMDLIEIFVCGVLITSALLYLSKTPSQHSSKILSLPMGTAMMLGAILWLPTKAISHA